jgi:hypothetical protein
LLTLKTANFFSVPSTVTFVSSGATTIVNFGSAGSFTFNPLGNWPLIVLQGGAVLATYGVIIVWALVLGAIVWGLSLGQFSGLFSGWNFSNRFFQAVKRVIFVSLHH